MPLFEYESRIEAPAEHVYAWHMRAGAFERMTPPWERVRVLRHDPIADGNEVVLTVRVGPRQRMWVSRFEAVTPGRSFRDVQVRGPFQRWVHTHRMEPDGPDACRLIDHIDYDLPGGRLGRMVAGGCVADRLRRGFMVRHRTLADDLAAHRRAADYQNMNVLISGAGGLLGSALAPFLSAGGHTVWRLVRTTSDAAANTIQWDPAADRLDAYPLEGLDAIVHLAGENIAAGRWTDEKKQRILSSRVNSTRLLCETAARLDRKPKVMLVASAIGFYGDRGDAWLNEQSESGGGFLAKVCRVWEEATEAAVDAGIRVVNLRFGAILSPRGGALAKMLPPFKLGGGGVLGSGRQIMSWIAIDDAVGATHHAMHTTRLEGPVNVVSPEPVSNCEFTRTLGSVLRRPTIMPLPAPAARMMFGQMADELLLASAQVEPWKLRATDYPFRFPDLRGALRHLLGRV